jgi:Raf kinase inhibitor-like YbhB/YbcL family protein
MIFLGSRLIKGGQEMKNLEVNIGFAQVPDDHTCLGKNISPRIEVGGLNAVSMAVIVDDHDAPSGTFTHWIMWNIEPIEVIPEGIPTNPAITRPIHALQGKNDFGRIGYLGPCPPPGRPHRYFFQVFGLNRMLDLEPGSSSRALEKAMKGHVLQQGEAMATFER